jgi:hypothetical protein
MNLNKLTRILVLVVSFLSIIFWVTITVAEEMDGGLISPMINLSYVVFVIAILLVLFYSIRNLISQKGSELKKTFISVGAFLILIVVSYIFADSTPMTIGGDDFSATTSKMVSTGLNAFYIIAVVAILVMFLTGYNRIKK